MTTRTLPQDVKAYLSAVRARLDDLPAEERDDLLADVEPSILESAEESDAPVELRLGPPHSFADELRAAAGLPPRAETDDAPRRGLRERLAAADAFFATSPTTRWLRDLAPLWWVLRGVVAVGLLELLYDESVFRDPDGYGLLVGLAVLLAVTVSVAVGLRRPRRKTALIVVNVVLALAAAPVMWNAISAGSDAVFDDRVVTEAPAAPAPSGLVYEGQPVENIYAFDRRGRLLYDVRLFMGDGRPLEVGVAPEDPNRRAVRTRGGDLAFNAFPIRYFEPGTKRVADRAAGAPARPGPLSTKPLD
jgi:hypothetical protein